jgi:hypothetical protein
LHTNRCHSRRRSSRGFRSIGFRYGNGLRRSRRKRGSRNGNGRVGWGLSSSLCLLTLAIDIFVIFEVKGTELHGSAIHLAVARHADGLFLVENSSLEAGSAGGSLLCGSFQSSSSITAGGGSLSLMLLLSG